MKPLHSDEYAALLKLNHEQAGVGKPWGRSGLRNFGDRVKTFLGNHPEIKTVLDFGAGQCSLGNSIEGFEWTNYDPGIPGIDVLPNGNFDIILSSDVMEHIEPEHVGSVIRWLHQHSKYYQYHLIACDPCKSVLPDGRNAHLTVREPEWWYREFAGQGTITYFAHEKLLKRGVMRTYACLLIEK